MVGFDVDGGKNHALVRQVVGSSNGGHEEGELVINVSRGGLWEGRARGGRMSHELVLWLYSKIERQVPGTADTHVGLITGGNGSFIVTQGMLEAR